MSRKDNNRKLIRRFELGHQRKPFDLHEVYHWAKGNNLWYAPSDLEEKKFVDEVSRDLREVFMTTPDGERVRMYHAAIRGDGAQGTLWANIFDAPKEHLERGFANRRQQSLADCRQLKTDLDYCNRTRFQIDPIQMSFNFDEDLAEEDAYKRMKLAA